MTVPKIIKLPSRNLFLGRGCDIPNHIWNSPKTKLDTCDFATDEKDGLNQTVYTALQQNASFEEFLQDPAYPRTYGICSMPNDSVASVIAAYMTSVFLQESAPNQLAYWNKIVWSGFDKNVFTCGCSFLVISSLSPNTSISRLEYVQEVIDRYSGRIPVLVVGTGFDPITMFSTKLFRKPSDIFFHSTSLVKRRTEVM